METKFTKGEWKHSKYAKGNIVGENDRLVANCMGYSTNIGDGEHIEENLANAQLIIAAPELLEALQKLYTNHSFGSSEFEQSIAKQVRNAIKKATE